MDLTPEQSKVLQAILRVGRRKGASPKQLKAAVETALVEANLTNPAGGDADSAGWRQERASLYPNPTNVEASASRFFDETKAVKDKYGRAGDLAAAVQRPAKQYRGRYQERSGQAAALLGGQPSGGASRGRTATSRTPGIDNSALRAQAVQSFLGSKSADPVTFAMAIRNAQDVPGQTVTTPAAQATASPAASGSGELKITGPNPGRIKPSVLQFGRKVSAIYGKPLTGSDGSGHSRLTVNGRVSQHTTGNATDIPASGTELLRMGRAALIAAGMPKEQAMRQKGGLFNVGAHQIIFLTNEGGNHFDHLHISSR